MTAAVAVHVHEHGNESEPAYRKYLGLLQDRFIASTKQGARPLFTVDAPGLWDAYLGSYPAADRQYHNCTACRQFIERFGNVVTVDEHGNTHSALWGDDATGNDRAAIKAMAGQVTGAKVTGVFLSSEKVWGSPKTGDWVHLSVKPPAAMVFKDALLTAGQKMAERREDVNTVARALGDFGPEVVADALRILRSDKLYASERVLGQAEWLEKLHAQLSSTKNSVRKSNLLWLAVAQAPAGFCHPRSSMIGTLLEDIAAGLGFADVSRRFAGKMHPLKYQRPQAAPAAGNVAQAEKIFAAMGLAPALSRRIATLEEVPKVWEPRAAAPLRGSENGGVFGGVAIKGAAAHPGGMTPPAITMTLQKFVGTVVADAAKIEVELRVGNIPFIAITAAADPAAPKIFQWDHQFAWYLWASGAPASQYGLSSGWNAVSGITRLPARFDDDGVRFEHQGDGVILMIQDARETREAGAALFPSLLRGELREVRATIEAYSKDAKMGGLDKGSAVGVDVRKGNNNFPVNLRVTDAKGQIQVYKIDRWD